MVQGRRNKLNITLFDRCYSQNVKAITLQIMQKLKNLDK